MDAIFGDYSDGDTFCRMGAEAVQKIAHCCLYAVTTDGMDARVLRVFPDGDFQG